MGKTGKAAKRRKLAQEADTADLALDGTTSPPAASYLLGLVSPAEVALSTRTLATLANHPELLKAKNELKALRGAVFDFQRINATITGTGTTLTSRISSALSSSRHTDALVLLAEARIRKVSPKLGALQRWVRDCDAASRSDGSFGDEDVLRVLDAILRSQGDTEIEDMPSAVQGRGVVRKSEEWRFREGCGVQVWKEVGEGLLPAPELRDSLAAGFSLLQSTPGPERLPPNHYPALLYTSSPTTVPLSPIPHISVTRSEVPSVPHAFLLADVLSLDECHRIVGAAEAIGFAPDQPVEADGSVLAHNLYWLADTTFMSTFWERFKHLLPQEHNEGKVTGLNARFRVYRYVPGAVYRPHIDGAWPASGIDPKTGEYLYDSSPPDAPQWSRLTFLIYLNDEFSNGCTTFFLPSSTDGVMNAYPVKPVAGCALVFPHGDTKGSLLHEGSPVGEGGAKYVIRTEVLYEVKPGGAVGDEAEFNHLLAAVV